MINVLKPYRLVLLINIIIFVIWLLIPDNFYTYLAYGSIKYYLVKSVIFYLAFYFLFSLSIYLFSLKEKTNIKSISIYDIDTKILEYLCEAFTAVAFLAFSYYIAGLFKEYASLIIYYITSGNFLEIKYLTKETGVPLLTQLCIPAGVLYAINCFILKKKHNFILLILIFMPGFVRGVFLSERLALMEIFIPFFLIYIYSDERKIKLKTLAFVFIGFIIFFVLVESFRSYYIVKDTQATGKISWGLLNFLDYLICPVNYAMYITDNVSLSTFPVNMLKFCTSYMTDVNVISSNIDLYNSLHQNIRESSYGVTSYTNISLIGETYLDLGYLNLLFIALVGCVIGFLYKKFDQKSILGLISYPIIFLGIIESYRINYFTEPRFIYPFLAVIFLAYPIIFLSNFNKFKYFRRKA